MDGCLNKHIICNFNKINVLSSKQAMLLIAVITTLSPCICYSDQDKYDSAECKWVEIHQGLFDPCNPPGGPYTYTGEFAYPSITAEDKNYKVIVNLTVSISQYTCTSHPGARCEKGNEIVEGWSEWGCYNGDPNISYSNGCCIYDWHNTNGDKTYTAYSQEASKVWQWSCGSPEQQIEKNQNIGSLCPVN